MNTQIERNKSHDHFIITGNWKVKAKRLQELYSELQDEDVRLESGNEEDLLLRIGIRLKKDRHEIISIIRNIPHKRR